MILVEGAHASPFLDGREKPPHPASRRLLRVGITRACARAAGAAGTMRSLWPAESFDADAGRMLLASEAITQSRPPSSLCEVLRMVSGKRVGERLTRGSIAIQQIHVGVN